MENPIVSVENLSLAYPASREGHVLENVNFTAERGERIALVGANGAGKSTLLLSMVGIIPAHTGTITIDGLSVTHANLAAVRRAAGLVFQNPDEQLFMPTLIEDVAFGPRNWAKLSEKSGKPAPSSAEIERRCAAQLDALNIGHLKNRLSHKLSGGEKRLGALASVLVMEPALLLLDEPTAFLDPKSRRRLIAVLNELPQTMIIATHDIDFAAAVCGRALILAAGQGKTAATIRADGSASGIFADTALMEDCGL
ncbi:MAG: energy-coupling factor ABC transporter ATP-binding protein [Spirochaetaceae bacterium]|jgi:cobalt/nickel transport system ATP-binding protein|nr:energy-coupling factor ABC transporter ATP-binding protein [Spirochaetaceae bacterium]